MNLPFSVIKADLQQSLGIVDHILTCSTSVILLPVNTINYRFDCSPIYYSICINRGKKAQLQFVFSQMSYICFLCTN